MILLSYHQQKKGYKHCIDKLNTYCKTWNLTINIKKTKVMIFNKCGRIMEKMGLH